MTRARGVVAVRGAGRMCGVTGVGDVRESGEGTGVRGAGDVAGVGRANGVTKALGAGGATRVPGAGGEPDSFGIAVPGTWTRYDLPEDGSPPACAEIRRGTAVSGPGGLDGRGRSGGGPGGPGGGRSDEGVSGARRILEGARRRGALYAAGTTLSDGSEPLTAGVMIFSVTPPPGKAASAHALARRFPAAGRQWARGGARTFSTETLPRVGPVRRLMGVEEGELADGAPYRLLVMHTVVPVPGSRRVLVVLCFSPDLPLVVRVHELFDTVTATFSFGYGPPTATG
ncbi:hypothetical protein [Streptomyces uncialis]|uniref:hypothetical protein n=1 Tax=Streptomyces uncialis TaxID=1048205 RepID=UPI002256D1C6|nr:hypothetical protein [Streptomyces uncialis]MCX4659612.1 hypothetical protein [Streptomyces uncialis]